MNSRTVLLCLAWLSVLPTAALGQPVPAPAAVAPALPAAEAPRPRIGLVLSGGGARGAAHIGVLKVLEREHVRIDAIAGTSMGAIVGGLYASGMPLEDIETLFRSTDWLDAFRDRPPRASLGYRRKQDDREYLVRLPLGLKGNRFVLPRGLVQGQKLLAALRQSTLPVADVQDFDRLPIPFRALATDITTGESVPLRSGDLAEAMRASMSAPGVFSPVEIDGRLLVDGGLVANLPVDLARSMGVDRLIVVDVSFPLQPRSELTSALELSNQMLAVLVGRETARARASLAATDVIIDPPLGLMGSTDFQRVGEAIDLGEQAAAGARPALAAFRADDAEWSALQAAHARPPFPQPTVAFVALDGPRRYEKLVKGALKREVGRTLDGVRVDKALSRLYGRGLFETLDWKPAKDAQGRDGLLVEARRKSWGPNYVRFGLDLQDDFEGNNSFNAGARFLVTELNAFGAEWRTDLQFGENPLLDTEYYQPLGYASQWFVAPRLRMENRNVAVLAEGVRVAEFRVREAQFGLDLGREFGNCCELRFGVQRALGSYRLRIGSRDSLPPGTFVLDANDRAEFDRGEYFARFTYDKLDSVYFPRQGSYFSTSWTASRERLGAPEGSDRAEVDWLSAFSRGRHTLLLWGSAGSTVSTSPGAVESLFQLGGFLRLSGQPEGALTGPHYAVARVVGLRKIGRGGDGFLNVPTYLGASFEAGNVWGRRGDASLGSLRKNAALFLGLDTYLGPLYLGAGFDEAGNSAYYLFLGRGF